MGLREEKSDVLWYYTDANNQPTGPVSFTELHELARDGRIAPDTYVVEVNGKDWKTFASVQLSEPEPTPIPKSPRRWPTILALVFVWPLGLYLLWRSRAFSKRAKILVTAGFVLVCLWFATPGNNKNENTPHAPSSVSLASGQGVEKGDIPASHEAVKPLPVVTETAIDAVVEDMELGDAVSGWFRGEIPTAVLLGKKYKTFGVPTKLWKIDTLYLIYNVGDDYGREFKVAMPRDPEYEKQEAKSYDGDIAAFYESTQQGEWDTADPIHHTESVKIDRIEQFHDQHGRVVAMPVVIPAK